MRGTLGHEAPTQESVHLLSLYEVSTGIVLAQRAVATKENEISAAPDLTTPERITGRIYSADAMHTQKKWCRQVIREKGDYLLIAKNNQSSLREDLALYLEDPEADRTCWQTASTCNKGHGRLEKRTLVATTDLNDAPFTRLAGGGASLSSGASGAQKRRLVHHRGLWPHQSATQAGSC